MAKTNTRLVSSITASGLDGNRTDRRAVGVKQVVADRILCALRMRSEAFGELMCSLKKKLLCGLKQSNSQEPGGPCSSPKRQQVEEACGSSSYSFSANSQGTVENATPLLKDCLEQAEDSFDDDPGRNHAARGVMRRHKLPAANGLRGAFIQPQPDALNDTDLRG